MNFKIKLLALTILILTGMAIPVYAVIPQLVGPLQALIQILPQLLGFMAAAIATAWMAWKMWLSHILNRKGLFALIISGLIFIVGVGVFLLMYSPQEAITIESKDRANKLTTKTWKKSVSDMENSVTANKTWHCFRGGPERTGNIDGKPGPKSANLLWVLKNSNVNTNFMSSPAVVGDKLYIGCALAGVFSSSGLVYCLDARTGEVIWKYETDKQIFSSPILVNGKVYIGEGLHWDVDCNLYCLNASDGELLWSFQTSSHVESSPAFMDGRIFFGAGEDGVFCVDANTGEKIWHFPGEHVDSSPITERDSVYFGTGYGNDRVYCLDSSSGEKKWMVELDYPAWGSPALDNGKIYLGIGNGNFLESDTEPGGATICLDAKSGKSLWRYEAKDSVITTIAIYVRSSSLNRNCDEDRLDYGDAYFGSRDGNLYCLDAKTGTLKWKKDMRISIVSSPAVVKNGVYFGCDDGRIYCLARNDGAVKWSFDTLEQTGGCRIISSPAVSNGRLYIGSCSQYLFCIGDKY